MTEDEHVEKLGKWEQALQFYRKAIAYSSERGQAFHKYRIGRVYLLQGKYGEAETELTYTIDTDKKYRANVISVHVYARLSQSCALLGKLEHARKYAKMPEI